MFPSNADEERDVVTIIGKKEAVEKAKEQLEAMIKEIVSIINTFLHTSIIYLFILNLKIGLYKRIL